MKISSKHIKKKNLPSKICPVCEKSFAWRKKWEKDWKQVVYCSQKCKMNKTLKIN
ncbi:DUF2256 domain-containing protein [Kaistella carnis]|uniref:DUF2256 domain-containing protein n=1 Tax=Kaistella carnis TaxID=1241979 RepID=UPI0028A90318|nr:DUF2256 domain-containing protein [Kaistella carnis]